MTVIGLVVLPLPLTVNDVSYVPGARFDWPAAFAVSTSGTGVPATALTTPVGATLSHEALFEVFTTKLPDVEDVT